MKLPTPWDETMSNTVAIALSKRFTVFDYRNTHGPNGLLGTDDEDKERLEH